MNKPKKKGTAAETAVVRYLNENDIEASRNPLSGNKDIGDIKTSYPIAIEVKNVSRMDLSTWIREATAEKLNSGSAIGVVWHKKKGTQDPGQWYVSMTGNDFMNMLKMLSN